MKLTADTITDEQISDLRTENRISPRVSEQTCPLESNRTAWRLAIENACTLALGILAHGGKKQIAEARARCAEILNAKAVMP